MALSEQNTAFVNGKLMLLEEDRLMLLVKTEPSVEGAVEVGWKGRFGIVRYRQAMGSLRGSTLMLSIKQPGKAGCSVIVPLDGSNVIVSNANTLQLRTREGVNYMWLRFKSMELEKNWLVELTSLSKKEVGLHDFEVLKPVGKGGMGKVFLARHRRTGERLALKVIDKKSVFSRDGHLQHMVDERLLLELGLGHPFLLTLRYAFQTDRNFYLATEFCEGGDLYHLLKRRRRTLSENSARQITAEVILCLEYIHQRGCVYRDLKPDNVLLDLDGHARLADFGLAKLLAKENGKYERTNSFCGTAQYTPPEMVQKKYYDQSIDLWCLGVFLYEVVEGSTPFYTRERDHMYKRIEKEQVKFSSRFSEELKDLIRGLLEKNPKHRLSLEDVKKHKFYRDVDWEKAMTKQNWKRGIYSSRERREVAKQELRMINTDKYRNLTVNEEREDGQNSGVKFFGKQREFTALLPGFNYAPDEPDEIESAVSLNTKSVSDVDDSARRVMEQAQLRHKISLKKLNLRSSRGHTLSRRSREKMSFSNSGDLETESVGSDRSASLKSGFWRRGINSWRASVSQRRSAKPNGTSPRHSASVRRSGAFVSLKRSPRPKTTMFNF
eukprot:CAMPEP_0184742844 /NCGR_PEP_ID=MMETSP0315-20130426/5787_1 /TAXON_ID=101924 /ORGANISM="Rhodosorus marinus, Strain UTEX LB 2760" /LENGTH=607 /DNA_ID=CAMNT_0027213883 /DNA_START=247 /DNA_END=2070 /DNA_ORIENTATION=-